MSPKLNGTDRNAFLKRFDWTHSLLTNSHIEELKNLLVEFSDIFAKHRFDVGFNTELTIKLTPDTDKPVYTQSAPTPIHLRDELLVELALMQYYNILTTLIQSKYSSPMFAQRKPSEKLRLLVDLRRVNHLLKQDYHNANFPISIMTDAVNHFAGKNLVTKLDCSQAYHCVQMADPLSIQLLSFNFGSRTYAYQCLAQGLNKSVTGFSSFIRHYLDVCLAANECTQFMDYIGVGSTDFTSMVIVLRKVFACIRKSGLKLSPEKCQFGMESINFLGNTITKYGLQPEKEKILKFLSKIRMPRTVKQVKRLIGFTQFFRMFIPELGQKLIPFYALLKQDTDFTITDSHHEALQTLKDDLLRATEQTLRLAMPHQQYVILCDASYHGAGFVLMIQDYTNDAKLQKTFAPVSFGSKVFTKPQLELSIYCKEFLALYYALETFAHYIWGAKHPVVVFTDNNSLSYFFQAKTLKPSLWNFLDRVLSFNIVLAHIPGKANAAADFLSRMQTDPSLQLELKLEDAIPVKELEVKIASKTPDVSVSSLSDILETSETSIHIPHSELEFLRCNPHLLENCPQLKSALNRSLVLISLKRHEDSSMMALTQQNPLDAYTFQTHNRINIAKEQSKDADLQTVCKWLHIGQPTHLDYLSFTLKKYLKQINRLAIINGVLVRNFYNDTGKIEFRQICLPKHLHKEIVYWLHNSPTAGHLGILKTVQEFRKRFYFPGFTEFLQSYVKNCLTCVQSKRVLPQHLKPPMHPISTLTSFPGDQLQIDIVGPFPSPVYKYALSAIDVFSKYFFAVPLTRISAVSIAKTLADIFFRHSYIPEKILSDLGTGFTSKLFHELTKLLDIELQHASLKHPQTVGVVERSLASLKRIIKIHTDEVWTDWYKYVDLTCFIHNTSFHLSIGCTPSQLFHRRLPTKPIDLRFTTTASVPTQITSDYVIELHDSDEMFF